jgi:hypothetical protein
VGHSGLAEKTQEFESGDLQCLVALRDARAQFVDDLVTHARKYAANAGPQSELTPEDLDILRTGGAFEIAEFYYLVQKFNLGDRRKIRPFLLRHNADIHEYIANKEKRDALGISVARLKESLFSETQIEKVVQQISDGRLRLSQTDLGCLLSLIMSVEKTRKAVVTLAKGGLLNRINIGQVLILSDGILEEYFERHLQLIVGRLKTAIEKT